MNRSSTSPFRSTAMRSTGSGSQSLELLVRTLQRENNNLVQEINVLKTKNRKTIELQDKIDLVLKHNTQLLNQNERLAKLINQKKSEVDIWKNKHENLSVNKSATSQLQIKRLLNEIQKSKEEACEIEHCKNLQINELKNQQHLEIQNLKRANLGNAEKYELQIRKLKEYCDKKDYESSDLNMKIVRLNKETEFEIGKLREEKERLRSDLTYEEMEHKKEIDGLKSKFDYNFHSEIQNLKKQHLNQIETLDYENRKLKEVIDSKNRQIDQIMTKHSKVKNNYEDSISLLKKQNQQVKDKITETQHIAELELNNLRDKMQGIKESEIALLRDAHQNQCDLLNREINKAQRFLDSRNEEIENMSKERNQMRHALESQVFKAKAELQSQLTENRNASIQYEENLRACDENLKFKNEEMKTLESYLKSQLDSMKSERDRNNRLLEGREEELDRERKDNHGIQRKFQAQIQSLREQCSNFKDQNERISRRSSGDLEDLKKRQQLEVRQLQTTVKGLEEEGRQKDNLINDLKDNVELLKEELKAIEEKVRLLQNNERQLRRQAKDNSARWDAKEKELNRLIKDQTQSMERTRRNDIDELKGIHDNKIRSLKHQIRELERLVEDKNKNLQDLKSQYEELVNKFEEVFGQQASKKNLDIKTPGWLPDTLATKSLFDVFLKNKVIQYCS